MVKPNVDIYQFNVTCDSLLTLTLHHLYGTFNCTELYNVYITTQILTEYHNKYYFVSCWVFES